MNNMKTNSSNCLLFNKAFLPFHGILNRFDCLVLGQTLLKVLNSGVSFVHRWTKYILYILNILPVTYLCTGTKITYKGIIKIAKIMNRIITAIRYHGH